MNYKVLKEKYGAWASWAWWDDTDINILPDDNTFKNPDYVFVGLNASGNGTDRMWGNFHWRHQGGKDGALRDALMGTKYQGAYMTDIIKWLGEPVSTKVKTYLKSNPDILDNSYNCFLEEIKLLGNVKKIFVFGTIAQEYVERIREKLQGIEIVPIVHYSAPKMYGKYKEYFHENFISE